MLQELLDLTDTADFQENGNIGVVGAKWQNDKEDLELTLEVNTGADEAVQEWRLICRSAREHKIVLGWTEHVEVANDHALLWQHTRKVCSLWFNGSGQNALAVAGELWNEHQKLAGGWYAFSQFLNTSDSVSLVEGGHGLLAEGPEPLIATYQQVMQRHGFKTSITSRPPLHWNGRAWVEPNKVVVLLIGESHVIASSVEARRVD